MSATRVGPTSAAIVIECLRTSLASGDFTALGDAYADDAVLDASLAGGRVKVVGPERAIELLASRFPGPGRLVEWSPQPHAAGIALWFERVSDDGTARAPAPLPAAARRPDRAALGLRRPAAHTAPDVADGGGVLLDTRLVSHLGDVAEHEPLVSTGWSGTALERLVLADGRRLIAKRIVPGSELDRPPHPGPRAARRSCSRPACWTACPATIDHAVVAAERDGDAWWVVMRDVSASLLADGRRLTRDEHRRILRGREPDVGGVLGRADPAPLLAAGLLRLFSPAIAEAERDGAGPAAQAVRGLLGGVRRGRGAATWPSRCWRCWTTRRRWWRQLEACGTTLIHADIRDEQIGLDGDRLILLDWGRASQGHPVVDFFWSICHNAWRVDATHDELVEDFRRARGENDDPRALELGVIGGLIMYGWVFGHSAAWHPDPVEREWARRELGWWIPRARRALETWSPV